MVIEINGRAPSIGENVFVPPTAVLIGDIRIAGGASIRFGAVLRGGFACIQVGEGTRVRDGRILEGCNVEDCGIVGMDSVVCQRARFSAGAMLAAGSVVAERKTTRRSACGLAPAAPKKELAEAALTWTNGALEYERLRDRYLTNAKEVT